MVIYYQKKFKKIFGFSVVLILVGIFYLLVLNNALNKGDYNMLLLFQQAHPIVMIIAITGLGLYLWSHYLLAKAKGYSGWFVLLGFLNVIGLVILFMLPDKQKNR